MKKYLGIVKIETRELTGIDLKISTKFSNSKSYIEKWLNLYPGAENIVLMNNEDLQEFFEAFEDSKSVTEKERKESLKKYKYFLTSPEEEGKKAKKKKKK